MPYGTLVWANSETYAACLLPTENSSPLTQVAVLSLSSGQYTVVLDGPHSSERGFDIYDVRCNDQGIVWIESNCYTGEWRVFQATLSRGVAGDAKPSRLRQWRLGRAIYHRCEVASVLAGNAFNKRKCHL